MITPIRPSVFVSLGRSAVTAFLFGIVPALAGTLRVPEDYPLIQAALDAANSDGTDTVLVAPGLYNEAINFNGKAVRLASRSGPDATLIQAPPDQYAVVMVTSETTNTLWSSRAEFFRLREN
jgi:pectin methylesterase-like acyl-CoA thioesterase